MSLCTHNTGCESGFSGVNNLSGSGTYAIAVPNGSYDLEYFGIVDAGVGNNVLVAGGDVTRDLTLNRAKITGSVHDTHGAPLPGVQVSAWPNGSSTSGSANVNSDGSFTMWAPPGSYEIGFHGDWDPGVRFYVSGTPTGGTFPSGTVVNVTTANASAVDFQFDVTYITGTITGASDTPAKAFVKTYATSLCTDVRYVTTSDGGTGAFRLIVTTGASIYVGAGATTGSTYRWYDGTTAGGVAGCDGPRRIDTNVLPIPTVDLKVRLYKVSGIVKDDLNAPIAGVSVQSSGVYSDPWTTLNDGVYKIWAEDPDTVTLQVTPPDFSHGGATGAVTITAADVTAHDFTLARRWRISGTIRRSNDLQVVWNGGAAALTEAGGVITGFGGGAATNVSGYYEIWLPNGTYFLYGAADDLGSIYWPGTFGAEGATVITMSGADITGKDFVLPPLLTLTPYHGPAGATITVAGLNFRGNNPTTAMFDGVSTAISATTGADGSLTTTITIPITAAVGAHTLEITGGNTASTSYGVLPPLISLSPLDAGRLSTVTVSGQNFKPMTSVVITWTGPAITPTATTTNASGSFSTGFAVPPGTAAAPYSVTATTGSLSASTSVFITTGVVYAAGRNSNGTLGDGTLIERHLVVPSLGGLTNVTQVSAGAYHALALRSDGTVWSWGAGVNSYGQLGRSGATDIPMAVSGLTGIFTAVAAGGDFSLALRSDGTVWSWGANNQGQLGDGTILPRAGAVQVTGLSLPIIAIAAGYEHAMALANDGTVYTWGIGQDGTIGNATSGLAVNSPTPTHLPAFVSPATAIAAGARHSMALLTDGTVRAWGYNADGELGDGTTTLRTTPTAVLTARTPIPVLLTGVTAISASIAGWTDIFNEVDAACPFTPAAPCGGEHSLALMSDGTVMAWGLNNKGQLGVDTIENHATPVAVLGLTNVTAIDAGTFHNIALIGDGSVRTWGLNNHGQLGDGTTTERHTPVTSMVTNASGVSAGCSFTLAFY